MRNRVWQEQKKEKKEQTAKPRFSRLVTSLLNGEFLTRKGVIAHLPFILFLSGLFVVYISLGYTFEHNEREKVRVRRQLEEKQAEYKTLKSELESKRRQSNVAREIQELELLELTSPPEIIEVNSAYFEE
jgi:hypothetical protein